MIKLKDLYNKEYIKLLSKIIHNHYPKFDIENFTKEIFNTEWKNKELKQRMRHISATLHMFLPKKYLLAVQILKDSFQEINYDFSLENMVFQDFIEVYGLDDIGVSFKALECFTINSSSEFAIRQFILKYPDKTMAQMKKWAKNQNEHIRRLASEGCRPLLPWAIALPYFKENPSEVLGIIDILKDDKSKYVQKSIANNINDISKDNPQIIKELALKWINITSSRDWVLKHGCRTLLKKGDKDILKVFGFIPNSNINITLKISENNIKMGENLDFSFSINSINNLGKLRVEYEMSFVRLNNKISTKVFKISEGDYKTKTREFKKFYSFKKISTRKHYCGEHKLAIIANGVKLAEENFLVNAP